MTTDERLKAAGYRQDRSTFRVAFSDDIEDTEMIFWTSPSGDVISEKQALARIEQADAETKEE